MKAHKSAKDWRNGTNRRRIAEIAERGLSKLFAYETLKPLVQTGEMEFKRNPDRSQGETERVTLPLPAQYDALRHEIGRVYALLGLAKSAKFESEEIPQEEIPQEDSQDDEEQTTQEEQEEQEQEEPQDSEPQDEKPTAKGKERLKQEWLYFQQRVREIRKFCMERERLSERVDDIGYRWQEYGARLIAAGIPADVLLLAGTMHWSPDTRQDAGIDTWDFNVEGKYASHPGMLAVSQRVMRERGISSENRHELFGYLLLLAENRVPIMVVGPAGTGKSFIMKQLADYMELAYGETPMSAGASRGDLLGRHTISKDKPFIVSEFQSRYEGGGIFCFEEIDRSAPEVLIPLHNALASDEMFNSVSGDKLDKSQNFVAGSTGNTFGLGANSAFTTGERLDAATIDRFRMGRCFLPVDEAMETVVFTENFLASLS